jgi:hypothetical protein
VGTISKKVQDREKQWFSKLRDQLKADGVADGWRIRFLGFVRLDNLEKLKEAFAGEPDVAFAAIESTTFSWEYWKRREGGLPR